MNKDIKNLKNMQESLGIIEGIICDFDILKGRDIIYDKESLLKLREDCEYYRDLFEEKSKEGIFCEECFKKVEKYLLDSLTDEEKALVLGTDKVDPNIIVSDKCLSRLKYISEANCYVFYITAIDKHIPIYICCRNIRDIIGSWAWYDKNGICIACKQEKGLNLADIQFILNNEGLLIHEFLHYSDALVKGIKFTSNIEEYYNDSREIHANTEMLLNWLDKYMTKERPFSEYGNKIDELLYTGITKIDKSYVLNLIFNVIYKYDKFDYNDRPSELTRKLLCEFLGGLNLSNFNVTVNKCVDYINDLLKERLNINPPQIDESIEKIRKAMKLYKAFLFK